MKILVCIKQVPDMESRFKVNSSGDWFSDADLAFRINEYDEYAVEQAVQLREQLGDSSELTVLSIGPDRVQEAIKKALAMGCDRGVHIQDPDVHKKDPWQVASIIAAYAKGKNFDLIFTGFQSQDRAPPKWGSPLPNSWVMPAQPPWSVSNMPTGQSRRSVSWRGESRGLSA